MTITGVDFVSVPTRNWEEAKDFYGETLGLQRSKRWGQMPASEFETGSLTLALMQPDAFGIEFAPIVVPIALQVDDVEAMRSSLEAKGVRFLGDTIDSGVCHMAHFRDPDGNVLMLHHRYAAPGEKPGERA
jgi:predicted enzyme related to lactoylglutathione lyase